MQCIKVFGWNERHDEQQPFCQTACQVCDIIGFFTSIAMRGVQQQVVADHEHDEDQHLGRHIERLAARKEEGRQRQAEEADQQQRREQPGARQIVGEDAVQHQPALRATG